jgi:8-oxo-dGTP pyrophosphatase MutT (NUDIX family)
MENTMFVINKENQFKEPQLEEDINGVISMDQLSLLKFYTIKNPSEELCTYLLKKYPGSEIRTYGETKFYLNPLASAKILKDGEGKNGGALIVESTSSTGTRFIVATVDNKGYIQLFQGAGNPGETSQETTAREANEEGKLEIDPESLDEVGEWSFMGKFPLVDSTWNINTSVFHTNLPYDKVIHLFPNGVENDEVTIVPVQELINLHLDETLFIVAIPLNILESTPLKFNNMQVMKNGKLCPVDFGNHHREFLYRFFLHKQLLSELPWLSKFEVFDRKK